MNDDDVSSVDAPPTRARAITTLRRGYWVVLTLSGATPFRSYMGQIKAVDAHGVRVALIDWLLNTPATFDLFVPWIHIWAALVATPAHDLASFRKMADRWHRRMGLVEPAQ